MRNALSWIGTGGLCGALALAMVGPARALTVIDVSIPDWEWEMIVDPEGPALPQTVVAQGPVVMRFDSNGSLDFGTLDHPLPVPPGPFNGTIDIEIVSMSLVGSSPVFAGNFEIGLSTIQPSLGSIRELANIDGLLSMDVTLDVFFDISLPDQMRLTSELPIPLGMIFGPADGIPEDDVLWPAFFVWNTIEVTPAVDPATGMIWDNIVEVHTQIPGMAWVPEPGTPILLGLGLAGLGLGRRKRMM